VIAGTHSGVGKTTVATGLMAAFAARGLKVGAAKVGPDYVDPGYHALATGRPGRNLDAWMCGANTIAPLAARAAYGCDLLVVEGVMGLFDGAAPAEGARHPGPAMPASTAHVARLLDAPVVLVVDAGAMSASVAAVVHGYATLDDGLRVAGVVLNRVGSDSHEALLRDALLPLGLPVLGALRRDPGLTWRDRHLGLVPVVEHPDEVRRSLGRLAAAVAAACDIDAIEALARSSPTMVTDAPPAPRPRPGPAVPVAVAAGPAFSFTYPDNVEMLEAAGARVVPFDPLVDEALPAGVRGLVAGGGFPEVFASALAANRPLLADVRRRCRSGLVTWAECGGLLWLCRSLDGTPMAGVLPCVARMTDRLALGYRTAVLRPACPLGPAGTALRGHEFHYSGVDPPGDALDLTGRTGASRAGFASPTMLAGYLHVHLAGQPALAEAFVAGLNRGSPDSPGPVATRSDRVIGD
jgi:cobyrinic acid a,c-diamide synthase